MDVVLEDRERMSLLALFLGAALDARRSALDRHGPDGGEVAITAAGMGATVAFAPGRVTVREGADYAAGARLDASLESLIEIARGRVAGPVLRRRARVGGNPLALLPLARVFRSAAES